MSSVFYRNPHQEYPKGLRGEGVYLYDSDGRQYLDGSGGAAVSCVGHWHPHVIAAIKRQVDELAYAHTAFFTNDPQERLANHLAVRFGEEDARVYFLSGGSEANEAAIKLARMYWLSRGFENKYIVISRHQSYHGNTLGALSLSGNPGRRDIYAPMLHDWPKIPPCYAYRLRNPTNPTKTTGIERHRRSRMQSNSTAPRTSPRSWRKRSSVRRWVQCRLSAITSAGSAKSAPGTTSC